MHIVNQSLIGNYRVLLGALERFKLVQVHTPDSDSMCQKWDASLALLIHMVQHSFHYTIGFHHLSPVTYCRLHLGCPIKNRACQKMKN